MEAISSKMDRLCNVNLDRCLQHGGDGGSGRVYRKTGPGGIGRVRRGVMSWFATMCCLEPAFPGFSGELWFPGFSGEFWLLGFFWGILGNQILLEKDCVRRSRIETTERRDHVRSRGSHTKNTSMWSVIPFFSSLAIQAIVS